MGQLVDMPSPRGSYSAAYIDSRIVAVGARDDPVLATVGMYDIADEMDSTDADTGPRHGEVVAAVARPCTPSAAPTGYTGARLDGRGPDFLTPATRATGVLAFPYRCRGSWAGVTARAGWPHWPGPGALPLSR